MALQKRLLTKEQLGTLAEIRQLLQTVDLGSLFILGSEFHGLGRWVSRGGKVNEAKLRSWLQQVRQFTPPSPAHAVLVQGVTRDNVATESVRVDISAAAPIGDLMGELPISVCKDIVVKRQRVDPRVNFRTLVSTLHLEPTDAVTFYEMGAPAGQIDGHIPWKSPEEPASCSCVIL